MVNKSKEILNGKLGSAVLPASVLLAQQLEMFQHMLFEGKENKVKHLIQYTQDFGNDCQNPFILENDKTLPDSPTYLSWDEFLNTLHEPSRENIGSLVSYFRLRTARRLEINHIHPNKEEKGRLDEVIQHANFYI